MYDSGAVGFQNGTIWSRGLPASWVMIVFGTSTVCSRSQITRYGLIGVEVSVSFGVQSSIHLVLMSAILAATPSPRPRGLFLSRSLTSRSRASSTSAASPMIAWFASMSLFRSSESRVAWMIVLPFGMVDALAGVDDRPLGGDQHLGGLLDQGRVRPEPQLRGRGIGEIVRDLG